MSMPGLVVAIFAVNLVVFGFFLSVFVYAYRGYRVAQEKGESALVRSLYNAMLGYLVGASIIFIILLALETLGFPVKYYICSFFEKADVCRGKYQYDYSGTEGIVIPQEEEGR